jgi:hypothetical protein
MADASIPAGYPARHLPSLRRRLDTAIAAVKACGQVITSIEVSPEGAVKVLTADPQETVVAPRNSVEAILRRAG